MDYRISTYEAFRHSVDYEQIMQYSAFYHGLHCFQLYSLQIGIICDFYVHVQPFINSILDIMSELNIKGMDGYKHYMYFKAA